MNRIASVAGICALLALTGCGGPKMEASRLIGRVVTITNKDQGAFTIQRLVANDNDKAAECVSTPNASVAPGGSYTETFFVCGHVSKLAVYTDRGETTLYTDAETAQNNN
jgi:hypothetical protein